jgi:hypothetical protein
MAARIAERLGTPTTFVHQSIDDVTNEDQPAMWRWLNETPAYQVDMARTRSLAPDVEDLAQWLARQCLD